MHSIFKLDKIYSFLVRLFPGENFKNKLKVLKISIMIVTICFGIDSRTLPWYAIRILVMPFAIIQFSCHSCCIVGRGNNFTNIQIPMSGKCIL